MRVRWGLDALVFCSLCALFACGGRTVKIGGEQPGTSGGESSSGPATTNGEGTGPPCDGLGQSCNQGTCCAGSFCGGSGSCQPEPDETSTTTTGPDDAEASGGNFVPEPEDGGPNPGCDPGSQDCPEGEKCTAYTIMDNYCCVDANRCVLLIGDKQLGDFCTREGHNDDCGIGLFCMPETTSGGSGPGVCLQFCDVDNQQTCIDHGLPNATCIPFNDGALPLCNENCDLLAQDCEPPMGCYSLGWMQSCVLPVDTPSNDGEACWTYNGCEIGLGCVLGDTQSSCDDERCCTPYCDCSDPGDPVCTGPGEECVCVYEQGQAPPGSEDLGLCAMPA